MRVLFVINSLDGGGSEKQLLLLAQGLAQAGFECVIYTLQDRPLHPRHEALWEQARTAGVEWLAARPHARFDALQIPRIRAQLAREQPTALWLWGHRADAVGLLASLLSPKVRLVFSLRDADEARIQRYRLCWRYLVSRADLFISNSNLNVDQLERHAPGARAKSKVIYNALTTEERAAGPLLASARPELLRVVMLGNVQLRKKGYDTAVELAALIEAENLPIEIHIGGRLDHGQDLQALIERHGVSKTVKLAGPIAIPREFLARGHLFLMASRVEGTPNALLEALSAGLPAICTRVGDVPYFARDGVHLRLTQIGDAKGMLSAIRALWADWPAAVAMGRAGAELCQTLFTHERMTREIVETLRELLAAPGRGQALEAG